MLCLASHHETVTLMTLVHAPVSAGIVAERSLIAVLWGLQHGTETGASRPATVVGECVSLCHHWPLVMRCVQQRETGRQHAQHPGMAVLGPLGSLVLDLGSIKHETSHDRHHTFEASHMTSTLSPPAAALRWLHPLHVHR